MGKKLIKCTNLYYFYNIWKIGGVESFFRQLIKKYQDFDLTIVYDQIAPNQLDEMEQYVRCIKYEPGMKFKCKKAFFNYNASIIDEVDAEEYIQIHHADYKTLMDKGWWDKSSIPNNPKINKHIAVSELAAVHFTDITGLPCEVCYNPYTPEKIQKELRLISATRLTQEKGWDRMSALAKRLDERGIEYIWTVYTDRPQPSPSKNIIFRDTKTHILPQIAGSDFLVQLSSAESYCYSIVEAFSVGTPVIATKLPVLGEIGATERNCIQLDFDLKNIDEVIDKMLVIKRGFKYTPPKDKWLELLEPSKNPYKYDPNKPCTVKVLHTFIDKVDGNKHYHGDTFSTTITRVKEINTTDWCKYNNTKLVEIIDEE